MKRSMGLPTAKFANSSELKMYARAHNLNGRDRYLLYIPKGYSRETGPEPVVFLHGLGLGLVQHLLVLYHFFKYTSDTPLLIPIQPQVSQDFFHKRYLLPMHRREKVARLTELLHLLGWVEGDPDKNPHGVTIMSHSKYLDFALYAVLLLISLL